MSSSSARNKPQIIIKRVKKVARHAHHGGGWKIAYADFVTAMMAFFLLMWLLSMTDEQQRRGLSEYFENPLQVSFQGGDSVGSQSLPVVGGGADLTALDGEVRLVDPVSAATDDEARRAAEERLDLEQLKEEIEASIDSIPSLQEFKGQLLLDLTSEGLRIQIVDRESRPMFASGSANLHGYASELLVALSELLNQPPNRISISGHTDATPYSGGDAGYSNWELSNDRANAARRALVRAGLSGDKIMRVVGLASTVLLDADNPGSAINRRISIVLMNQDTETALSRS